MLTTYATTESSQGSLLILDQRAAILGVAPMLAEVAERCGKAGAMHWLPYLLDDATLGRRTPILVLGLRAACGAEHALRADNVAFAALLFEYRVLGRRTGVVTMCDAVGFNGLLAPVGQRMQAAAVVARALRERGARIVLSTFEGAGEPQVPEQMAEDTECFAVRRRRCGRMLPLLPTLEATLAQMGKSTRFNLRYYRRRLEKQVGCTYLPDAREAFRGTDFEALNAASLNPVKAAEFRRRMEAATTQPGSFLAGLRDAHGNWLSLVGGWRQGTTTVLFWQMNSKGWERHSLGTVMRSYFLEHEISRGAEQLLIYGGTPHAMRHAFAPEPIVDLVLRRRGIATALLCQCSRWFASERLLMGKGNYLASVLQDPALRWGTGGGEVAKLHGSLPGRSASPKAA